LKPADKRAFLSLTASFKKSAVKGLEPDCRPKANRVKFTMTDLVDIKMCAFILCLNFYKSSEKCAER
jgi:hypothetical protein